jgi:thymidylate synthase (FAD)
MAVRLIGMTVPSEDSGCTNANDLIAYTARVSNPSNQLNLHTAPKLLQYLIRNQHWSPFEMVSVTMEIKTTRDISRQILRHRSFSFQEFSQRYADPTKDLDYIVREARLQDSKNRQNSIEVEDEELEAAWQWRQNEISLLASRHYAWAIANGIAKEQARVVLPEGNMETVLYMSGTLRSWIHYCELRGSHGTQKEHRIVALDCWKIIKEKFPDVAIAVEEHYEFPRRNL